MASTNILIGGVKGVGYLLASPYFLVKGAIQGTAGAIKHTYNFANKGYVDTVDAFTAHNRFRLTGHIGDNMHHLVETTKQGGKSVANLFLSKSKKLPMTYNSITPSAMEEVGILTHALHVGGNVLLAPVQAIAHGFKTIPAVMVAVTGYTGVKLYDHFHTGAQEVKLAHLQQQNASLENKIGHFEQLATAPQFVNPLAEGKAEDHFQSMVASQGQQLGR